MNIFKILNQVSVPDNPDLILDYPSSFGLFNGGVLAIVGWVLWLLFMILVVIWVVITIYGAFVIIKGALNEQELQKGLTIIKNVWFGIVTIFIVYGLLSLAGVVMGFGRVDEWSQTLYQCPADSSGTFYFRYLETNKYKNLLSGYPTNSNINVYCCKRSDGDVWEISNGYLSNCNLVKTIKR
jgi:hypothetical protein